jgi:hypothetical protein
VIQISFEDKYKNRKSTEMTERQTDEITLVYFASKIFLPCEAK